MRITGSLRPPVLGPNCEPRDTPVLPRQRPRADRVAALLISDRAGGVSLETLMRVL